jgi:hypothetical protein
MSQAKYDIFTVVVSFINNSWEPTCVIVRIFEVHNTIGVDMANKIKVLFDSFCLLDNVVAHM